MRILVLPREDTNPYQDLLYREMRHRGVQVTYLGELTRSHTLNLLLLPLEMAIRRLGGARVVHLHWVYAFGLFGSDRSAAVRRAAEAWFTAWLWVLALLDMRLVWTAHNVLPQAPVFADDVRGRRRLVAACDLVIAHSKATLQHLAALGIVPRRSAVIPHGPFTEAVESVSLRAPGEGHTTRQLLFFGKIRPYKGVDTLLEAFAALPPELDAHLTVAGECGDSSLAAELTGLASRTHGRVTLRLEWISEGEASRLLYLADAVVLPYRKITTSGSGVLALSHGRPLIVPDLPGLAELPDDAVIRYDGTALGLRDVLASIIDADAGVLAKMSSAAYEYCASMSWSQIADKTLSEITRCLVTSCRKASSDQISAQSLRDGSEMAVPEHKRIAVVLPVGPKDAEGALDTLASALYYLDKSRVVVVVDDTGNHPDFGKRARELSADIMVLPAPPRAPGGLGGLWVKIAAGYEWLLERYEPDVILRLDGDALIIGAGIEELAIQEFAKDRQVGLLGSYRVGPDGGLRDWSWPARRVRIEAGFRGMRYPSRRMRLRQFITQARQNAYVYGEHPLGGSYIHSHEAAHDIYVKGWFNQPSLATSKLGEDHIMALITVAAGYHIADFGRPEDPMALRWQGLPAHPDELLANKKLLTHSVRSWGTLEESEIRSIFRAARA